LKKIEESGFPYPKLEMKGQHPNANGPDRLKIMTDKSYLSREYPHVAFFKGCTIRESGIKLQRPILEDHTILNNDLQPYKVRFTVNLGLGSTDLHEMVVLVTPSWSPLGAKQFKELVIAKFYDDCRFFRVIKGFMAQTGIAGNPAVHGKWMHRVIVDDPPLQSNTRGRVTFATSGKNSRTTQIFFNFGDNSFLDKQGFSPFGEIISGLDVLDKLYFKYGEGGKGDGSDGKGPSQGRISHEGNLYLNKLFPHLSYIVKAEII